MRANNDEQPNPSQSSDEFRIGLATESVRSVEEFIEGLRGFDCLSAANQQELLLELIRTEIQTKRQNGEFVDSNEYRSRFDRIPPHQIDELFALPELPPSMQSNTLPFPSKYQSISVIGEGGVGTVYKALDTSLKRTVALKTVKSKFAGQWHANQRLLAEAEITGRLQHPGIPPVYEQGLLNNGDRFFAMKVVDGKTLETVFRSGHNSTGELIGIVKQIAQTVAYAHEHNVIHRDIKPQNIIVATFGEIQVMDWGMAKMLSGSSSSDFVASRPTIKKSVDSKSDTVISEVDTSVHQSMGLSTKQGDILGTPAYLAPEQALGDLQKIGKQSDVFALGHLLFEALTGSRVFSGSQGASKILEAVSEGNLEFESRLEAAEADDELKRLCSECLAHSIEDRPSDATIVAERLDQHLQTVQTRLHAAEIEASKAAVSALEQRRRYRAISWLTGIIAIVSIGAMFLISRQSDRARLAAEDARSEAEKKQEISEFLIVDFLKSANPSNEPNRDLKVRTVLERAAQSVGTRFKDRPEVDYEIRLLLAESFESLGEFEKSRVQLDKCLIRAKELYGNESTEALYVTLRQANLDYITDNPQNAILVADLVLEHCRENNVSDSQLVMSALSLKSSALTSLGKFEEANLLAAELIKQVQSTPHLADSMSVERILIKKSINELELNEFQTAQSTLDQLYDFMEQQGFLDENQTLKETAEFDAISDYTDARKVEANLIEYRDGDYAKAEQVYDHSIQLLQPFLDESHPTMLGFQHDRTLVIMRQGRFQEAQTILKKIIPLTEDISGSKNETLIRMKNSLGSCHTFLGETEEAIQIFTDLESLFKEFYTETNHNVVVNYHNLGSLHRKLGEYKKSEAYFKKAIRDSNIVMGEGHMRTLVTQASYASTLGKLKRFDEAESILQAVIEKFTTMLGADHPETQFTVYDLARMYIDAGRQKDAKPHLVSYLKYSRKAAPDSPDTMRAIGDLGVVHYKLKEFTDAIPLLTESHRHRANAEGKTSRRTLLRFFSLIQCLIATNEFDRAENLLTSKLELVKKADDEFMATRLRIFLGRVQLGLSKVDSAETLLLDAFEFLEAYHDARNGETKYAMKMTCEYLIELYDSIDQPAQKGQWERKLTELERAKK